MWLFGRGGWLPGWVDAIMGTIWWSWRKLDELRAVCCQWWERWLLCHCVSQFPTHLRGQSIGLGGGFFWAWTHPLLHRNAGRNVKYALTPTWTWQMRAWSALSVNYSVFSVDSRVWISVRVAVKMSREQKRQPPAWLLCVIYRINKNK